MENASKALLIAAGIMIGLIVITMIAYAHGKISNYYESKELTLQSEQLADFNKQFLGYNRADVRGSDLISLVNKIIDYNTNFGENGEKIENSYCIWICNKEDIAVGLTLEQTLDYEFDGVKLRDFITTDDVEITERIL